MTAWHILTGEYPPQRGGVSDYTRLVARGLAAAGDRVVVWAPPVDDGAVEPGGDGITVHRLPDRFGTRSLRQLSQALDAAAGGAELLVQYVPQAFGWSGANLAFCRWLRGRSRRNQITVMFHEVMYQVEDDRRLSHYALAAVNRRMAALVAGSAGRAFVSISAWRPLVAPLVRPGVGVAWLPVPSGIPVMSDRGQAAAVGSRSDDRPRLVGHFGTYGGLIVPLLTPAIAALAKLPEVRLLLIGAGSEEYRRTVLDGNPQLAGRIRATGELSAEEISGHISACDLMIQPYPDGISTRRTSAVAALAHRKPVVSTDGHLTDDFWRNEPAVTLVPVSDPAAIGEATRALLADETRLSAAAARAASLYDERFDLRHTVEGLQSTALGIPAFGT